MDTATLVATVDERANTAETLTARYDPIPAMSAYSPAAIELTTTGNDTR